MGPMLHLDKIVTFSGMAPDALVAGQFKTGPLATGFAA
jgi:hypothetical protein